MQIDLDTLLAGLDDGFDQSPIRKTERAIVVLGIFQAIKKAGDPVTAEAFINGAVQLRNYKRD